MLSNGRFAEFHPRFLQEPDYPMYFLHDTGALYDLLHAEIKAFRALDTKRYRVHAEIVIALTGRCGHLVGPGSRRIDLGPHHDHRGDQVLWGYP